MVEFRPAGLGVWFWVGFGAFVPFSTICLFFPSFNDDLGTMPTRRPYSWKKPREWPMARLAISNKQINRLVRTFLWRRVTEQALHGSSFVDIPDEINQACIGDLLRISEAFAAPLSNLFTFVKNRHPACPFITHKQLALHASPRFWQYGLLAFIARCCSFDNQHRHQGTGTAQAVEGKPQKTKKKKTLPQTTPGQQNGRHDLLSLCRWEWQKRRQTKQTKPQRTRP